MTHVILWGCPLCSSSGEERYTNEPSDYVAERDAKFAHYMKNLGVRATCPNLYMTIDKEMIEAEA